MSAKKEKNVKEKKKISLTSMIFIALIAGAITGMVLHYLVPDSCTFLGRDLSAL